MAKRRTVAEKARADSAFLAGVGAVAIIFLCMNDGWVAAAFTAIWLYLIWEGCAKPTVCDVKNVNTESGCAEYAPGRLRACWRPEHRRVKHRTLLAWMRTPAHPGRTDSIWHRKGHRTAPDADGEEVRPAPAGARLLLLAIVATGAGAMIAVIAQFVLLA